MNILQLNTINNFKYNKSLLKRYKVQLQKFKAGLNNSVKLIDKLEDLKFIN